MLFTQNYQVCSINADGIVAALNIMWRWETQERVYFVDLAVDGWIRRK